MRADSSLSTPLLISGLGHIGVLLVIVLASHWSQPVVPSGVHAMQAYLAEAPAGAPPRPAPEVAEANDKPTPPRPAAKELTPPVRPVRPEDLVVKSKPAPHPDESKKPERVKVDKPEPKRSEKDRAQELAKIAEEASRLKAVNDASARDAKARADLQKAKAARAAELSDSLSREEAHSGAVATGAQARYAALLSARFERNWVRPAQAHKGLSCEVKVSQVPGGVVTAVKIAHCNGDGAVEQSIIQAVYRSSPLPPPEDMNVFEREFTVVFAPDH